MRIFGRNWYRKYNRKNTNIDKLNEINWYDTIKNNIINNAIHNTNKRILYDQEKTKIHVAHQIIYKDNDIFNEEVEQNGINLFIHENINVHLKEDKSYDNEKETKENNSYKKNNKIFVLITNTYSELIQQEEKDQANAYCAMEECSAHKIISLNVSIILCHLINFWHGTFVQSWEEIKDFDFWYSTKKERKENDNRKNVDHHFRNK